MHENWGKRTCEAFGISMPFIGGGMANISEEILAAAVSNAGGLGVIAAGGMTPERLRQSICSYRELSDKPFLVNMMAIDPTFDDWSQVVIDEHVPGVALGTLTRTHVFDRFLNDDINIVALAAAPSLAAKFANAGATAIVPEGMEAAGHIGEETTIVLLPAVVDAVQQEVGNTVPVIAAGGIRDARGVAASAMLGADGVQFGTLLLYLDECQISDEVKAYLAGQKSRCTMVTTSPLGVHVRVIANGFAKDYAKLTSNEERDAMGRGALRRAMIDGQVKEGSVMAGQVAAYIGHESLCPASELLSGIYSETRTLLCI